MQILRCGDPRLQQVCAPVAAADPEVSRELAALHATLGDFRRSSGYGRAIAAPQVGIMKRMIAMHLGAGPFALINPQISWRSEESVEVWDDCLSIPEHVVRVKRHRSISLAYQDEQGRLRRWERLPGDLAELIQHEIDHLDGVLMYERRVSDDAIRPISEHELLVMGGRKESRITLEGIRDSLTTIPPEFLGSPQFQCPALSRALGCQVTVKLEFANPLRSFKARGAFHLLAGMSRQGQTAPIVCASAGNWGQAVAYAAGQLGQRATVFVPSSASPLKIRNLQALGVDLRQWGEDFDGAKAHAREYARAQDACWVEDGLAPQIAEGHGSIALELLERGDAFDSLIVPVGNGSLINGLGRWFKAASPATRIIGVCAASAPAMEQSWRAGRAVDTASARTIADGIAVRCPIPEAVEDSLDLVDEFMRVDEDRIRAAIRLLYEQAGHVVEASAAVGVAALAMHPETFAGQHVALVLTGSNIAVEQHRSYITE